MRTNEKRPIRSKSVKIDYSRLVEKTLSSYTEAKGRLIEAPISARNPDPEAKRPLNIFNTAEWVCDIELAVRSSLQGKPHLQIAFDTLEREAAGFDIPENEQLSLGLSTELIQTIGPALSKRMLQPALYFKRQRK
jgi:hypothetical protein